MNENSKKYMAIVLYHTIIDYQLNLVIEALEELVEYNPNMHGVLALMKEVEKELENEGRRLLEKIEKGNEDAN